MKENLRDDLKMYLITDSDILKGRDFYKYKGNLQISPLRN